MDHGNEVDQRPCEKNSPLGYLLTVDQMERMGYPLPEISDNGDVRIPEPFRASWSNGMLCL